MKLEKLSIRDNTDDDYKLLTIWLTKNSNALVIFVFRVSTCHLLTGL